jgi:hypothetical protein
LNDLALQIDNPQLRVLQPRLTSTAGTKGVPPGNE